MEHLWVSLKLSNGDKLLIGCVYLSPSGNRHCSMAELYGTLKLTSSQKASHILIGGDFNAPQVDWTDIYSDAPPGHYSHDLIRCVQDNFLTQHVTRPTRHRHGQSPSTLDLILTNEEGMVQNLQYLPDLGRSDHVALQFDLECYTLKRRPSHASLNYNKGDYNLLRSLVQEVDWSALNDCNVNQAYHLFVSTIRRVVAVAVPQTHPKPTKNLYITKSAIKLKRQKASLWTRYTHFKVDVDYACYGRSRNKLRKLMRRLREDFELRISKELKYNPKIFRKYSNSHLKTRLELRV